MWPIYFGLFGMGNIYSDSYYDEEDDSYDNENNWNSDDDLVDDDGYPYSDGLHNPRMADPKPTPPPEPAKPELLTLFDTAARVAAKNVSCQELEQSVPPLDERMLKRVAFHACPKDSLEVKTIAKLTLRNNSEWDEGERLANDGRVHDMTQVGFMVAAVITTNSFRGQSDTRKVSFTFEKQSITSSSCESCKKKLWCSHVIAAVLHRIQHAKEVAIHAPVTETLSTLTRDQLQKLVQYAINEDPSSILEKVFKRIDEIRDQGSDINVTAGAPDPTFGLGLEGKSTWELSLDEMKENFKTDWRRIDYDFVVSYQENVTQNQVFYRLYLQKVVDLARRGQVDAAGKVLIEIVNATISGIPAASPLSRKLKHFVYALEKLCCHYIVSFSGQARRDLILVCQGSNRKGIMTSAYSSWADVPAPSTVFPSIADTDGVMGGKVMAIMYEPLCASMLDEPSQRYYDLINGVVEPVRSEYQERLAVMMMRYEALRRWRDLDNKADTDEKLCRLGIVILRKLLKASYKYSALSGQEAMDSEVKSQAKKRSAPEEQTQAEAEPPKKKRRSERRSRCMKTSRSNPYAPTEKMDVEKADKLDSDSSNPPDAESQLRSLGLSHVTHNPTDRETIEDISSEVLAYCSLHICYYMYTTLSDMFTDVSENSEILAAATLRGLELARLRLCWPTPNDISVEEHQWLEKLEQQVGDAYFAKYSAILTPSFRKALHKLHMKVLLWGHKNGTSVPPGLELIHLLVKCAPAKQQSAMALAVSTVCHSHKPIRAYTIPHNNFDMSRIYERIVNRFKDIFTFFVSRIDIHDATHKKLLLKVLSHYEHVKDGQAMRAVFTVLIQFQDRIVFSEETQLGATKFFLHCIKLENSGKVNTFSGYAYKMNDIMTSLGKMLGTKFRDLALMCLDDLIKYFGSNHFTDLVYTMYSSQPAGEQLPGDLVTVLFTYFESKSAHQSECCDLLVFFEPGGVNYNKALKIIKDNAQSFSATTLLKIAKKEHERAKSPSSAALVFTKEVDDLIRSAFKNYAEKNKDKAYNFGDTAIYGTPLQDLQWVFKAFTAKKSVESVARGKQFTEVTTLAVEAFPFDAKTLISFCAEMLTAAPLLEKCKDKFGPQIDKIYNMAFVEVVQRGNHTSYSKVIRELDVVRVQYNKYVRDSADAFTKLVKKIRDAHKGKKKLIKMLNEAFPAEMKS